MSFLAIRHSTLPALCMLGSLCWGIQGPNIEKAASYLVFQVPGARGTYPMSVNGSMAVAGYYLVSANTARGFLRDPQGNLSLFSVRDGVWTEPESINSAGDITGFFELKPGFPQGFLRRANGEIVTFNPPGSDINGPQALPLSINDYGEIAGIFPFPLAAPNGFRRSTAGAFTTFDFSRQGADYGTVFTSLNASGTVVGFNETSGNKEGFFLSQAGYLEITDFPIAPPPAGYRSEQETTVVESINAEGTVAGWYQAGFLCLNPCSGANFVIASGGFLRSAQGNYSAFNAPGLIVTSPQANLPDYGDPTAPNRIVLNGNGTVVGSYIDAGMAQHGFMRDSHGTVTSFDPPRGMQTTATSINDAGVIAGSFYYDWATQTAMGFLRIPLP